MIFYKEALAIISREGDGRQLSGEWTDIREITGRICAEKIISPTANQQFDNSAMDGFAVRIDDFNGGPAMLEVAGRIVAGKLKKDKPLLPGQCYEIMTGAPLPTGCDAVVPVEKTEGNQGKILFREIPREGDNIRRAGEDFAIGDTILEKGTALITDHVLTLATLGIGQVKVLKRPMAALISTGKEVIDDLGANLKSGQIYNSTGPYLRAALPAMGAEILPLGGIGDDHGLYQKKLQEAVDQDSDIILSTGAVSAGSEDFVPSVLKDMGAEIFFHKVAIRPGKPILFARFPDQGPFFFGLPGNPASSAAGLRFFVYPLIRSMQELLPEEPQYAILQKPFSKNHGLRSFVRASLHRTGKATLEANIPEKQQSFMVKPFIETNAWAVIEEDASYLKAGDLVEIYQ